MNRLILFCLLVLGSCLALKSRKGVYRIGSSAKLYHTKVSEYLRAHEDLHKIHGSRNFDQECHWTIEDAGDGKVCLKSSHGTYLKAFPEENHQEQSNRCGLHEAWEMIPVMSGNDYYRIKSYYGYYLKLWPEETEVISESEESEETEIISESEEIEEESEETEIISESEEIEEESEETEIISESEEEELVEVRLSGKIGLQSAVSSLYLGANTDPSSFSFDQSLTSKNVWTLEPIANGAYCLKGVDGTYIRAWPEGNKIDRPSWCREWEWWVIQKDQDGFNYLKSYFNTYLRGSRASEYFDSPTTDPIHHEQKWLVVDASGVKEEEKGGKRFFLKSYFDQSLYAPASDSSIVNVVTPVSGFAWELQRVHDGVYCIKSPQGTYLRAWPEANKLDQAPWCKEWEYWTFVTSPRSGTEVNLLSYFGTYLRAWPNSQYLDLAPWNLEWEDWKMIDEVTLKPFKF